MYEKLAYALIPSGYKSGKLYSFVGGDMTFTRSSTATRINKDGYIEFVPTGVPRLNYPIVNGKVSNIPELLLEPARINYAFYSEDFSSWTPDDITIDADSVVAPDGNTTADTIYENTVSSEHRVLSNSISFTSGTSYTISVFAKYNGRVLAFHSSNQTRLPLNVTFDLELGDVVSSAAGTATIEAYPNGWYKCSVVTTSGGTGTAQVIFRTRNEDNDTSFVGDISKGMILWGSQVEVGYLTSYIPTFDATGSRNAETANNGTADFNDFEGVLYAEIARVSDGTDPRITISDGSTSDVVEIKCGDNEVIGRVVSTSEQAAITGSLFDSESFNKIVVKYKFNDVALWVNGFELGTDTSATMPVGLTEFSFDDGNGGDDYYGSTRQILAFNEALNDTEIESLTSWRTFEEMASYFGYV
jgi:hypothetical protein